MELVFATKIMKALIIRKKQNTFPKNEIIVFFLHRPKLGRG
jgi:hypothetical protein